MTRAIRARKAASEGGSADGPKHRAEVIREFAGLEGEPGDQRQLPPPPPLRPQKSSALVQALAMPHGAIGGDNFGFQESGRGETVAFGEAAKAATLYEPGHADSRATAALHIAATACRDGVVDGQPERSGLDCDGVLRGLLAFTSLADESIMQGDGVHLPRPDQQGISRVGGALITVATAFDDQPQMVLASEVDRRHHVGGLVGRHRVHAGGRGPAIEPAGRLRQTDLIADVIRIS